MEKALFSESVGKGSSLKGGKRMSPSGVRRDRKTRWGLVKALQIGSILQKTLELEPLLRCFSREVAAIVPHSSVTYRNEEEDIDLTMGRIAKHSCSYRLVIENKGLGQITFTRGRIFTAKEISLLDYLDSALVYPLRNSLRYRTATYAALTDPLTGVYNRNVLERALRREVGLSRRYKTPFSIIVMDIDGFKEVNDRYGHEVGDTLIKRVTVQVSQCLRKTDIFSRYGGDEFVVLLSNTQEKGATILARHIKENVRAMEWEDQTQDVRVTVSIGIASLSNGENGKVLFARADQAMYQAKREGGDRIRVAPRHSV